MSCRYWDGDECRVAAFIDETIGETVTGHTCRYEVGDRTDAMKVHACPWRQLAWGLLANKLVRTSEAT